ncbi:MAG: DUF2231 domain-containing protein [Candidatus Latescibacterota bacterium]|jgi:uncharacterized membrane protein
MADYHPLIVHFPIALLITGSLAEFFALIFKRDDLRHFAFWALVLGLTGTIAAYISGSIAEEAVEHIPSLHNSLEAHEEIATIALCTWIGLVGLRILLTLRNWLDSSIFRVYLALLMAGTILIGITGYRGGQLVYQHGAGFHLSQTYKPTSSKHIDNDDD